VLLSQLAPGPLREFLSRTADWTSIATSSSKLKLRLVQPAAFVNIPVDTGVAYTRSIGS
jgi:hypothetical protein